MKSSVSGFTLIELVAVIVVLGILAATAFPRFIDVSTDARISIVNSLSGAMTSAANMVKSKAEIAGVAKESSAYIEIDGILGTGTAAEADFLRTRFGYPHEEEILNLLELDSGAMTFDTSTIGRVEIQENCYVDYNHANDYDSAPIVTTTVSGC